MRSGPQVIPWPTAPVIGHQALVFAMPPFGCCPVTNRRTARSQEAHGRTLEKVGNFAAMPAHAARGRRAATYTLAGLVVAAVLLLTAGPQAARALGRSRSSTTTSAATTATAAPSPSPVSASVTTTPTPTPSASPTHSGPYRVVGLGD